MLASLSQALASATEAPGQGLSHLARARLVAETMPVQNNGSTENAEFEGAEWWALEALLSADLLYSAGSETRLHGWPAPGSSDENIFMDKHMR